MMIKQNARKSFRLMNWLQPHRRTALIPTCQPEGFVDITLYEYQLKLLAWLVMNEWQELPPLTLVSG